MTLTQEIKVDFSSALHRLMNVSLNEEMFSTEIKVTPEIRKDVETVATYIATHWPMLDVAGNAKLMTDIYSLNIECEARGVFLLKIRDSEKYLNPYSDVVAASDDEIGRFVGFLQDGLIEKIKDAFKSQAQRYIDCAESF